MKDAYYFPHFCNARHDRKIKRLRKELGLEGYGIFFMLLEVLREQTDFRYPLDDLDLLSDEMGTSEQKLRCVICNYQLFQVETVDDKFFSPKLIFYLEPYFTMKEQRRLAGQKSGEVRKLKALEKQNEHPLNGCSTDDERTLNENEQSKVKKSKVKKSKVEDIYITVQHLTMSKQEFDKLVSSFGELAVRKKIEHAENYAKLKNYTSLYLTLNNWLNADTEQQKASGEDYSDYI